MTTAPVMSKEELMALLRENGILDELKDELMESMPTNRYAGEGGDGIEQGMGGGGFPWRYWKRRDGRVITGPEPRETLYQIYIRKGYTPLPQYGNLPSPGAPVPCCPNLKMKEQQFHVLLANGGAKELAIAQVLAAGWHENPPTVHGKKITFPQMKDVVVDSVECDECDKPIVGVKGTNQIISAMRQHCRAAHNMSRRDVDEMLWRIGYLDNEPKKPPVRRRVTAPEAEE